MKPINPAKISRELLIFTDGACSGNPGPGGWGSILSFPEGQVKELGGGKSETTNNEMEMVALIRALKEIQGHYAGAINVFSDSVYVLRGIQQWIWGWRKRNWLTAEGAPVANRELWEELFRQVYGNKEIKIDWYYSRGHQGIPGNERCDEIAVAFSQKRYVQLYEGPLLSYPYAIYDLPEDGDLPEMKPLNSEPKKKAFSYLSLVGGVVYRHPDWASCERRVKGQSGAKFKKAETEKAEGDILESWGLSRQTAIKE